MKQKVKEKDQARGVDTQYAAPLATAPTAVAGSERYSPVEQWRAEAEINRQAWLKSQALVADLLAALKAISDLASGWDADGALGQRAPLSWESVARMSMDIARGVIAKVEGDPPPSEGGP